VGHTAIRLAKPTEQEFIEVGQSVLVLESSLAIEFVFGAVRLFSGNQIIYFHLNSIHWGLSLDFF
jgi:hypothetical protein